MRFEEANVKLNGMGLRRNGEVVNMLSEFLKSGIEVAEVKDWEYSHKSLNSTYQSLKHAIECYFKGEIRLAIRGEHLYIARLEK